MKLFDLLEFDDKNIQSTETTEEAIPCKIRDWRSNNTILFKNCKKG